MKIIRVFGIVVGVHAVVILAIMFATPGCSSTGKPAATAAADTPPKPADSVPTIGVTGVASGANAPAAPQFQPIGAADAPAAPSGGVVFYSPTRPGTPAAAAVESQPVADVTPATTYTVAQGDSWWTIAKKNHLKISDLAAANNLRSTSALHPGQKLLIPSKSLPKGAPAEAVAAPAAPAKAQVGSFKHVVKKGETLGSIAHAYGLRVGDLATQNSISDPSKIHPGQELTIPAGGHVVKPAKTRSSPEEGPAAHAASQNPAPAVSGLPSPLPASETGPGAASGPGADVPVIKIEPSEPSSQSAPANPPK